MGRGRLAMGTSARLPLASVVTTLSGPACASMLALEVMPGVV